MPILSDLSGGRNGVQSPLSSEFPADQSVEAINVDYRNGGLGRKRAGSYDVLANTTGQTVSIDVAALIRHVATGKDETQGEVWAIDVNATRRFNHLPAGTVWSAPASITPGPDGAGSLSLISGVSFNGKLFFFYSSTGTDRLKVYDPLSDTIRVVGLSVNSGTTPTIADNGAGAYPAAFRAYRVRWAQKSGSTYIRISEPTPALGFTTSGAGAAARVTRQAAPGEGETHWILEAGTDTINYYRLAEIVIGTTFYDDAALVATYPNGELSEISGTYTLPTSFKFGVTDGNRLIMAGNWLDGNGSRVSWTPVLGSLNRGDDERVFKTATLIPYIDLDAKNGGDITGIGHINGMIYVFKYRQIWRLSPTGDLYSPYAARRISSVVGTVHHKSIALGEDAYGNAALYFMSHRGPYRVGQNGLEYVGRDIEDITRTAAGSPNINTAADPVSHSVFYADVWQWWLWIATGVNAIPNELLVLDVKRATRRDSYGVRGGWTRMNGEITSAYCSCLGQATLGTTGNLRPWIGLSGPLGISICGYDDVQSDRGAAFQAYVKTAALGRVSFGKRLRIDTSFLMARHHSATPVTIQRSVIRDVQQETTVSSITMASANIDKVLPYKFEGGGQADCSAIQLQLGDAAAVANQWQLDELQYDIVDDGAI